MRYARTPILVVDDEEGIRDLLKDNLEEQGYICHTAPSGDVALQVLATETVDLALVDIMMPGMTGLSFFEHAKERYPDVAIIFVTAMNDLNIAVQHLKHGLYDYMVKPITRKRLQEAVVEALDKRMAMRADRQHWGVKGEQDTARPLSGPERETPHLAQSVFNGDKVLVTYPSLNEIERSQAHRAGSIEGTVSIMFTDLEGSTELINLLGDEEFQNLLRTHNSIIRQQVSKHGGLEVKSMGDGFMIVFASARKAVACGVDILRSLQEFNQQSPEHQLKVRVGVNVGETIKEEGDFFGRSVVLAARIISQASGMQILVSDLFCKMTSSTPDIKYIDHAWKHLKGFAEQEHLYEVDWRASSR